MTPDLLDLQMKPDINLLEEYKARVWNQYDYVM